MDINSILLVRSMIRQLVMFLDLANKIPEADYKELVLKAQKHERWVTAIYQNASRGNVFLIAFFLKELLEAIANEK